MIEYSGKYGHRITVSINDDFSPERIITVTGHELFVESLVSTFPTPQELFAVAQRHSNGKAVRVSGGGSNSTVSFIYSGKDRT